MEQHDDNALIIYTDGSMLTRPRRGGYAFRIIWTDADGHEQHADYDPDGQLGATNNEMELTACVEALRLVTGRRPPVPRDAYRKIVVYVDSAYICNNVIAAQMTWPQAGWKTRSGDPVLNADLWQDLIRLQQKAGRVEFRKVKAHQRKDKRNPHNHAVDKLARASARRAQRHSPGAPLVTRKTACATTAPTGVPMDGQVEMIRIVSEKRVPRLRPRTTQYKYEVVRRDSPNFGQVDDAFAEDTIGVMRRNGRYEVRFASKDERPGRWITEIIEQGDRETSDGG